MSGSQSPARRPRYGWFVGVAAAALLAFVIIDAARNEGTGPGGLDAGERMPPFAAPLALGSLQGDVNIARGADEGEAGRRPACAVRGSAILNACALWERGPVVLAFLATRALACTRQLDTLERVRAAHPGVQVAAVSIRGERDELARLVRRHRWRFPVAHDRDGILVNLYGVAVCPHVTYALPGGIVVTTSVGELDGVALERRVVDLERRARAAGWRPGGR